MGGEIDNSDIPRHRSTTLAYNATVVRLFAGCYHEWVKDGNDWKPLAKFLRGAELEPGSGKGALLVDAGIVAPGITPFPRAQSMTEAIGYIVRQTHEANNFRQGGRDVYYLMLRTCQHVGRISAA